MKKARPRDADQRALAEKARLKGAKKRARAKKVRPRGVDRRTRAETVDEYLAAVPPDARSALEKLRATIRAVVPDATEVISYQIPTFRHRGSLVAYAAFKDHCSFFVMSPAVIKAHEKALARYVTSKGTIQFAAEEPLPPALVRRLVKARIAENEARGKA